MINVIRGTLIYCETFVFWQSMRSNLHAEYHWEASDLFLLIIAHLDSLENRCFEYSAKTFLENYLNRNSLRCRYHSLENICILAWLNVT